jgi:lipid-binding SYLF domain-containing protein
VVLLLISIGAPFAYAGSPQEPDTSGIPVDSGGAPQIPAGPESDRLDRARVVLQEMREVADGGVTRRLLGDCTCIAVFPGVIQGGLAWGARHGRGVIACRDSLGHWSPPSFLTLNGGSFGLQIGVQSIDVVLYVMTEHGARSLIRSGFTLGGQASVAAGPLGRAAEGATDIRLDAEIYSYARARGVFAGIALQGARVNTDGHAIERFYGIGYVPESILFEHQAPKVPAAAERFQRILP